MKNILILARFVGMPVFNAFLISVAIRICLSMYAAAFGLTIDINDAIKDSFQALWIVLSVLLIINEFMIEIIKEMEKSEKE